MIKNFLIRSVSLPLIVFGLMFSGCATTNKISQDFKPDTNFKNFKTITWRNFSSDIPTTNNTAIKTAIEKNLATQGLEWVAGTADLAVDLNILTQEKSASSPRFGISLGLPVGNSGSIGLGTSKLLGNSHQQEGLIISGGSPEELDAYVKREEARWRKIVRENNIKPD